MNNTKMFTISFLTTLLVVSSVPLYLYLNSPVGISNQTGLTTLNKFSSYEELKTFLETSSSLPGNYWLGPVRGDAVLESGDFSAQVKTPEPAPAVPTDTSETAGSDYSKTNIQVEGVDEADIVKTDGEYIYIVSGGNITIVKAVPAEEAQILSKIILDGYVTGIFVNGDKLAVFETEYGVFPLYETGVAVDTSSGSETVNDAKTDDEPVSVPDLVNGSTPVEEPSKPIDPEPTEPMQIMPIRYDPPTTSIKVYDISNKENPALTRNFSVDGNYFDSRMIGDYVYVVATQYTFLIETDVFLPRVHSDNETEIIPADDIYYYNFSDTSYSFTTIVALNIQDDAQETTHETILVGGTSAIYVSQSNIYLTFPDYNWQENETMTTTIQRITIDKQTITPSAAGEVPGYILNQFSMDESGDYFRIATTTNNFGWRTFAEEEQVSKNNIYVLDVNLNIVGRLEDLAPGEQIYSTRFMDNRCYMVTFRNIDPLFVIDLTVPTSPTVLGQLKVTGYSGYLQPYDENHLIGIGKETSYDAKEDFAWYQGIKISLFDVSDVSNPIEVAKFEIGDRGSDSPVLWDHKALLFDRERNLLVIPVTEAKIDPSQYDGTVPDWAYGEPVWQGAYVFTISPDSLVVRNRITHMEDSEILKMGYYYGYDYQVQRSLYIDNVLYTVSSVKVKMNNLDTLEEINTVKLS
jgi:inhibitor of cysteine peptidase